MTRRRAAMIATAALLVGSAVGSGPAHADGGRDSLPRVPSGALPGPELLYADPVVAPPLRNAGQWRALPILVSGATSYRSGEWLYQDFLQDDHGARGVPDPFTPHDTETHMYSPSFGSFTYPDDPAYADNAADLVELRVKPLAQETAFRVTFNTMKDPARAAFTIALGGEEGASVPWPHGAGVRSPAELFLTWHGDTAELAASDGTVAAPARGIGVEVDQARHQVEVRVPHAMWDPGRSTVRTTIGIGLWDQRAGRYLAPTAGPRTATTPGGGSPTGTAIVNVGPRLDEPQPLIAGATIADTLVGAAATTAFWRERQQATARPRRRDPVRRRRRLRQAAPPGPRRQRRATGGVVQPDPVEPVLLRSGHRPVRGVLQPGQGRGP